MGNADDAGVPVLLVDRQRVVTCDLAFTVAVPVDVVLQIVASRSSGETVDERLDVIAGGSPSRVTEIQGPNGARLHLLHADQGRLTVAYRAQIAAYPAKPGSNRASPTDVFERQMYLRPSRYCPSDHLFGFAMSEFGTGPESGVRVARVAEWISRRIGYVPGSSTVHDSAEDTLLRGMGTCRDFAHLGIALCRAVGIPARFVSVYAPGLLPMDFHAVFETFENGRWCVHDATRLAPRTSLIRIATGRDAADTAFADITTGIADLDAVEVSATVGSSLPTDDHLTTVELA
jgi:transglutaminase-like putative cysteine protease